MGATILAGSHVGANTISGANSVVSEVVESDSVYVGNPARKIMTLEEFFNKRLSRQLDEAVDYVKNYKARFEKIRIFLNWMRIFFVF